MSAGEQTVRPGTWKPLPRTCECGGDPHGCVGCLAKYVAEDEARFELVDEAPISADLQMQIPGAGLVTCCDITAHRVVMNVQTGIGPRSGGRPVLVESRDPAELRAAARVLEVCAREMELLREALRDVQNRERRHRPGRIPS